MKRIITNMMILVFAIIVSLGFSILDDPEKIHLKVTKEENGETSVFEKVYSSMDDLKSDDELKNYDGLIFDWSEDYPDGITINKKIEGKSNFTWKSDDEEEINPGDKKIIIRKKDDQEEIIEIKADKKVSIESTGNDEEEATFTYKIKGDGDHQIMWINEENEGGEVHKEIKVFTTDDEGKKKVLIQGNSTADIEVEIEKQIIVDGEEKTVNKKVWILKDGKKEELEGNNSYDFETEDDKIKITVNGKNMAETDFSGGTIEGDNVVVLLSKADEKEGWQQTMNVNIEDKNGEKFIEINIKRTDRFNVTISEILKGDETLEGLDYSLKNNLKPSQFHYYPNPSNGRFNLSFILDQQEEVTVKVLDILGNEVYKETLLDFTSTYDNQIDLSGKEKGIYILQIIQKKKALSRKILIE